MGNSWGSSNYKRRYFDSTKGVSICDNVEAFPVKLKQAIFSAASRGTLKRGTWNNCAFNAAGSEHGESVRSVYKAAEMFGVSKAIVQQFINLWDRMPGTDEECTNYLRTCIEKAGLFIEPGERPPRIIKFKVYENQEKKLREQFDALMEANMIEGADLMEELLVGAV